LFLLWLEQFDRSFKLSHVCLGAFELTADAACGEEDPAPSNDKSEGKQRDRLTKVCEPSRLSVWK
jgi:hypothetical protein